MFTSGKAPITGDQREDKEGLAGKAGPELWWNAIWEPLLEQVYVREKSPRPRKPPVGKSEDLSPKKYTEMKKNPVLGKRGKFVFEPR